MDKLVMIEVAVYVPRVRFDDGDKLSVVPEKQ
jgi:hypothetical protein